MFPNLNAEMSRIGLTAMDISKELDFSYTSLRNKLNGTTEFLCSEIFEIQERYFPTLTLEYLFKRKKNTKRGGVRHDY